MRSLNDRWTTAAIAAVVAIVSAIPSLLWAFGSPGLLTDDYVHLESFRRRGVVDAVLTWSFENPARPLAGLYHLLNYGLIGDRPVLQALLLAVLNGALAAAIWLFGRRWLPMEVALGAALLYAIAPNRSSSRFWFATGNYVLAPLLAIVACHLLFDRRRPVVAAATFGAAVLVFEGVIGLVAAAVAGWALLDLRERWRSAPLVVAPSVLALGFIYLQSPKRGRGLGADVESSLVMMSHGVIGSGFWGESVAQYVGAGALAALAALSLAALLPPFQELRGRTTWTRRALVLTVITTAPLIAASLTFAVRGIFDRTNTIPMIAVSVLLASTLHLVDVRRRPALLLAVLPVGLYLFSLNLHDVDDYQDAAREGRVILQRVSGDVPPEVPVVIVFPPPNQDTGTAPFVYANDLDLALRLRPEPRGTTLIPWHRRQCEAIAASEPGAIGYDWLRREIVADAEIVCARY